MSDREIRATKHEFEVRRAGNAVTAEGYAAVFDTLSEDLGGFIEKVASGTFRKTLQESDIRVLYNHDESSVLGRVRSGTADLAEDSTGLHYRVHLPNTQVGNDVAELLERGDVDQSSFGFETIKDEWELTERNYPLRTLQEVRLYEVSIVTFPAYTASRVGLKRSALRSLSSSTGVPVERLLELDLRDVMSGKVEPEDDATGREPSDAHSLLEFQRRLLDRKAPVDQLGR